MTVWTNYFVFSTRAFATEGHLPAETLRQKIKDHDGKEAYHCAYDLEKRDTFANYNGLMRPALGYVWFDFDSHDGGAKALEDSRNFVSWLGVDDAFICYSGSKGFHVGVPFGYFGLDSSPDLGSQLNALANTLKKTYESLDTTIYNANRKFRALGSQHPKTGLYKIALNDLNSTLGEIRLKAQRRGELSIPVPMRRSPLAVLKIEKSAPKKAPSAKKDWDSPTGEFAFTKCEFLKNCKENPAKVSEPQWYAALSIVSRFQEGRKQCHGISMGHPGYSVHTTNAKVDQALSESAPRTCENISTLWDGCHACPLFGKINSPVNITEDRFYHRDSKGRRIPDYNSLLRRFQDDMPYKTIADMKAVYVFQETHYVEFTPIEIKAYAEDKFEPKPQEKIRQEFYNKTLANQVDRRTFFTRTTENKLCFDNGVLDLQDGSYVLRNHSPTFGFRHCLPYSFNTSSKCETFNWWINDVMLGDKELVCILQEFMGYVIRGGEYNYHKALWLSGSGRNGKSTFLSVLKALIGTGNYSTLSIRQITSDKFASADLDGKIANFSEETSPEELSDSGPFKNLTGDGELLAQKKYGDPYSFRNRAKLIMTYNETPELRDLSPGMLSRPIIVPWEKDLSADELQDKTLKAKLLAELPGIFNFALAGWKRLEAQGQFSFSPKSQIAMNEVRSASCSALQWLKEYVTFLPIDANSANREVHRAMTLFEAYRDAEGRYAYKASKFFRRIKEHPEMKKRWRKGRESNEYFSLMIRSRASFSDRVEDSKRASSSSTNPPHVEY